MKNIKNVILKTKKEICSYLNNKDHVLLKKKFFNDLNRKTIKKYSCFIDDKTFFNKIVEKNYNDRKNKKSFFKTIIILKDFLVIRDIKTSSIDISYGIYDSQKDTLIEEVLLEFKIVDDKDIFFNKLSDSDFKLLILLYNNGFFAKKSDLIKCNDLFLKIGVLERGACFDISK